MLHSPLTLTQKPTVKAPHSNFTSTKDQFHKIAFDKAMAFNQRKLPWFWSQTPAMEKLRKEIFYATKISYPILIQGNTGTGKEIVARAIHDIRLAMDLAPTPESPWVATNSANIPEALAESVLFGHERGAFTSARERQPGKFEIARKGTLFIDEIQLLPLPVQGKLLRALQQMEFETLGGKQTLKINCQIVAAANIEIGEAVANGTFREDLFYRFSAAQLYLPSLSERLDEIPAICMGFLEQFRTQYQTPPLLIDPEALDILKFHEWKGNLRELEYTLLYSAIRSNKVIRPDDLHPKIRNK
jgi:DNA-binding NtrC family response regulator